MLGLIGDGTDTDGVGGGLGCFQSNSHPQDTHNMGTENFSWAHQWNFFVGLAPPLPHRFHFAFYHMNSYYL